MLPLISTKFSLDKKNIKAKEKVNDTNENSEISEEKRQKLKNLLMP